MAEPWDRLEGEPNQWYARFEQFRLLGPNRTIVAIYNDERAKKGKSKLYTFPPAWQKYAAEWRWRERAEAWDEAQRALARKEEEGQLRERRRAWIAQAQAVQGKAVERLLTLVAEDLSPRDVLRWVVQGMKLEMVAMGEAIHTSQVKVDGSLKWEDLYGRDDAPDPVEQAIEDAGRKGEGPTDG